MGVLTICVILSLLACLHQIFSAEIPRISCDAGLAYVGQNASVICKFPFDVGAKKGEVIVEWLPANASKDALRKEALICGWQDKGQTPNCVVKKGFRFNGAITTYLKLVIPNVNKDYAGAYFCFLLSLKGTRPEECELIVKERIPTTATTTTNGSSSPSRESENDEDRNAWLIPLVIGVFLLAVLGAFGYALFRKRTSISRMCGHQTSGWSDIEGVANPLIPMPLKQKQKPACIKIKKFVECFELTPDKCTHVKKMIEEAMEQVSTGKPDTSFMSSMQLHSLPNGKETGAYVVVDLSSTILKVHHVKLRHPKPDTICKSYAIPPTIRLCNGIQLFDFIVESVDKFLQEQRISKKRRRAGLIFSFPCEYTQNLTEARLVKWTNGFQCEDVIGKNVKELLQQALERKMPECQLDVVLVTNDAASTLISAAHKDCRVALTLVNGFHTCYMEKQSAENSSPNVERSTVLVNTDLGALGENGRLDQLQTVYDKNLDKYSLHPQRQIFEKMVSLTHIGEIVRHVLVTLAKERILFKSAPDRSVLNHKECFTADYISLIERDDGDRYLNTEFVLRELQLESVDEEDCRIVHAICLSVMKRAAYLAGIGLAAIVDRLDASGNVTVAVDGAPYRYFPLFHQQMCEKAMELVRSDVQLKFDPLYHGSVIGAARTAAVLRPYGLKSVKARVSMKQ